jgi:GNAT superfamily N-acetyltransferase
VSGGPPPVTWDLVARIERVASAFSVAWLEQVLTRPDHPSRLDLRRFGPVVAAMAPGRPGLDFMNRIYGLTPDRADELPTIAAAYGLLGLRPWIEVAPHPEFEAFADALDNNSFRQIGVYSVLAASCALTVRTDGRDDIVIEPARDDESELFGATRAAGYEISPEAAGDFALWSRIPGVTTYLARRSDEVVGSAALFVQDGVGYLADGATLPAARGHGVQAALIKKRVADATETGCDVVASLASPYGTSHRNLERGGLRIAFQLSVWRAR